MRKKEIVYSKSVTFINSMGKIFVGFSSLASILSFLGYTINKNQKYIILGIGLFIITVALWIAKDYVSVKLMTLLMNCTIPDTNIEVKDKKVVYGYKTETQLSFESKFSVKVRNTAIRCLEDNKIKWTAGEITKITPVVQGQVIENVNDLTMAQIGCEKQVFRIKFENGREITKNDDWVDTGFRINDLNDPEGKAKTSLCVGIYDRTKSLTLKVFFDTKLNPRDIRLKKYAHFIDNENYESKKMIIKYDNEENYNYVEEEIKKPIYGGKYEIDWVL